MSKKKYWGKNKMNDIRWVAIKGESKIEKNEIRFISKGYSNAKLRCNKFFRGGKISFKITFHSINACEKPMLVFVGLNEETKNPKLHFGISSTGNFSISQEETTGWKNLSNTEPTCFGNDIVHYDILIEVEGSQSIIYVNDVLVCKTEQAKLSFSQISLNLEGEGEIIVQNFNIKTEKLKAFVIMDFSDKFKYIYTEVIKPVCNELDIECFRADEYNYPGSIIKDILDSIRDSDLIIADITPDNANVYFEIGYAYALGKNPVLLMDKERKNLPFDISSFRIIMYNNSIEGAQYVKELLTRFLKTLIKS